MCPCTLRTGGRVAHLPADFLSHPSHKPRGWGTREEGDNYFRNLPTPARPFRKRYKKPAGRKYKGKITPMRHLLVIAVLVTSALSFARQTCPAGYHHEGTSAACWPDVSRQEQQQPTPAQPAQTAPKAAAQTPTQPKATIVFYRPGAFYGKALKPSLYVDGKEIGRLSSGRYLGFETTAGPHTLTSSKKNSDIQITLGANETEYVEMVIQSGTWRGSGRLIPVPAEEGKQKSSKLKSE